MPTKKIVFGLGSNQGERQRFLDLAIENLQNNLRLTGLKKSAVLKNKALLLSGSPEEWDKEFLNLAVSGDIDPENFPPLKILEIIKNIENNLGRINRGKWSPREIDIDILAIGDLHFDLKPQLQIPHPELFNRDFFIKTFSEIEPELLERMRRNVQKS